MPDCTNQSNDRDHKQKNATSSDTPHNWQGGHYARYFAWNIFILYPYKRHIDKVFTMDSHPYHEERDKDVDDIQPHQCVLGARKAPTHFVWKEIWSE